MSFEAFDTRKIDEYAAQAKASWGTTDAYKEYEQRAAGRTKEAQQKLNVEMMNIFAEFGKIKELSPESEEAIALAKKLQDHITEHYYTCTDKILLGLGAMYSGGGDFTTNIDEVGGEGTAVFAYEAIKAMVGRKAFQESIDDLMEIRPQAPRIESLNKYIENIMPKMKRLADYEEDITVEWAPLNDVFLNVLQINTFEG